MVENSRSLFNCMRFSHWAGCKGPTDGYEMNMGPCKLQEAPPCISFGVQKSFEEMNLAGEVPGPIRVAAGRIGP